VGVVFVDRFSLFSFFLVETKVKLKFKKDLMHAPSNDLTVRTTPPRKAKWYSPHLPVSDQILE
jgi:hypothetical protein